MKVRTLALGALMAVGVASIAEAQVTAPPGSQPGVQRRDGEIGKRGGHRRMGRRPRGYGLGRDLNLTETQRTQIAAIHQRYQPQHRALHERARPFLEAARTARQNWDSAGFRTNTERARQVLSGGEALRNQERAEIRAILTPEQRTRFDARQKEMSERRAKLKAGGRRGAGQPRSPASGIQN